MELRHYVQQKFNDLVKNHKVFTTKTDKHEIWETYLAAFPESINPVLRSRTVHDCNSCKSFIRAAGNVVAIVDGDLVSIWDVACGDVDYQLVADRMSAYVKGKEIDNIFLHAYRTVGVEKNFGVGENGEAITYEHYHAILPDRVVKKKDQIGPARGGTLAAHDVFKRGMEELDREAVETVLELIAQNSLYRGAEFQEALKGFLKLKKAWEKAENKDTFAWLHSDAPEARLKNTVIGELVAALSGGEELDTAVRQYEAMVAPANYKRPTALVTKAMVEKAKAKVEELGLTSALARRYASATDLSVADVLWAGRTMRECKVADTSDPFGGLASRATKPNFSKVEEIGIDDFIEKVLPTVEQLEVFFERGHKKRLVSLITGADLSAPVMFKWDNPFSWSYTGDLADSDIRQRVKLAGGNVEGEFCNRLGWFNYDDLDFHMQEPGGYEIFFGNKTQTSPSGGRLDVDMNAGAGSTRTPVENIYYPSIDRMKNGVYTLFVHQFARREKSDVGFAAEIQILEDTYEFSYPREVAGKVVVAKFEKTKEGLKLLSSLDAKASSENVWGLPTQEFVPVKTLTLSPNCWREPAIGNKHFFFFLEGCKNDDESARGFYNEFLRNSLDEHRKVLEMVGSKVRASSDASASELSGLGFSSTQRAQLIARVSGRSKRVLKINF